ncbi:MAG: serine/threonine protein kinase [Pseudomonadales bacterium]
MPDAADPEDRPNIEPGGATPYATLTPEVILESLESVGLAPSGGLLAMNSYENRVYQLELNDDSFVIAKFYRPGRLSDAAIAEEHAFTLELAEEELPCVAPLVIDGQSLFSYQGYRFALFPRRGGQSPDIEIEANLKVLARTIGRIHAVGRRDTFTARKTMSVQDFAIDSREFLLASDFIPQELRDSYETLSQHLVERLEGTFEGHSLQRIHGDCHLGNLLWRIDTPNFVDFDDAVTGPPIQDLWMLLSGERSDQQRQLGLIVEAYDTFSRFDPRACSLIEPLRTLRMMRHAAWIGRRWEDPAFPPAFPWFAGGRYWSDHILHLREQLAALDEPPLM